MTPGMQMSNDRPTALAALDDSTMIYGYNDVVQIFQRRSDQSLLWSHMLYGSFFLIYYNTTDEGCEA